MLGHGALGDLPRAKWATLALLGHVACRSSCRLTGSDRALLLQLGNGSSRSVIAKPGEDLGEFVRRVTAGPGLCADAAQRSDGRCRHLWSGARSAFDALLSRLFQKGLKAQASRDDASALALFGHLAALAPRLAVPHLAVGSLQLGLGRLAAGEESLRRGLQLDAEAGWEWLFGYSRFWGTLAPRQHGGRPTGVLHVGAHEAREAALYALQGIDRVVWVEANPDIMGTLQHNVGRFGHVTVHALCWNVTGKRRPLHLASRRHSREAWTWSSTLRLGATPRAMGVNELSTIVLPTTTGTDLLAALAQRKASDARQVLDFLVLDIHGAEYECLQGFGAEGLEGFRYILVELSGLEMFQGQRHACEVHSLLTDFGFDCTAGCSACGSAAHHDAFYIRRGLRTGAALADLPTLPQTILR